MPDNKDPIQGKILESLADMKDRLFQMSVEIQSLSGEAEGSASEDVKIIRGFLDVLGKETEHQANQVGRAEEFLREIDKAL